MLTIENIGKIKNLALTAKGVPYYVCRIFAQNSHYEFGIQSRSNPMISHTLVLKREGSEFTSTDSNTGWARYWVLREHTTGVHIMTETKADMDSPFTMINTFEKYLNSII